jgi:hypothetical protein
MGRHWYSLSLFLKVFSFSPFRFLIASSLPSPDFVQTSLTILLDQAQPLPLPLLISLSGKGRQDASPLTLMMTAHRASIQTAPASAEVPEDPR